jgi:hypothetical protein
LGQFSKNYRTFYSKKLSLSSQKFGFGIRDPRSGIRKKPIPDPGSRGQKGTGSWISDPDPQHWSHAIWNLYMAAPMHVTITHGLMGNKILTAFTLIALANVAH